MRARWFARLAIVASLCAAPCAQAGPRGATHAAPAARPHHDGAVRGVCTAAFACVLATLWTAHRRLARRVRWERAEAWLRDDDEARARAAPAEPPRGGV